MPMKKTSFDNLYNGNILKLESWEEFRWFQKEILNKEVLDSLNFENLVISESNLESYRFPLIYIENETVIQNKSSLNNYYLYESFLEKNNISNLSKTWPIENSSNFFNIIKASYPFITDSKLKNINKEEF
jgi:hypothetical protein